jgi:hypothetical protein
MVERLSVTARLQRLVWFERSIQKRTSQYLLGRVDLSSLICINKICHSLDLWIVFVSAKRNKRRKEEPRKGELRFGFLTIKRIDFASSEHVGKNEIFEDLYSLGRTRLIIITK